EAWKLGRRMSSQLPKRMLDRQPWIRLGGVRCGCALAAWRFLAKWLAGGSVSSAVVSGAASGAACLLLTRELLTHVTCAVLTYVAIHRTAKALRKAASAGGCLLMGFEAPSAHRSWRPVYPDTDTPARCRH